MPFHRRPKSRWDLFSELINLPEETQQFIENLMRESPFIWRAPWLRWSRPVQEPMHGWIPVVDVIERKNEFLVRVELPGVEKEDVRVSVRKNTLIIEGERKSPPEIKEKDVEYYLCESVYGKFHREISLPVPVEAEKIKAVFKNGVLEIELPKAEKIKPKEIPIKTA